METHARLQMYNGSLRANSGGLGCSSRIMIMQGGHAAKTWTQRAHSYMQVMWEALSVYVIYEECMCQKCVK